MEEEDMEFIANGDIAEITSIRRTAGTIWIPFCGCHPFNFPDYRR